MKFIFTCLVAALALSATAQSTFVTQVQSATGSIYFTRCLQLADGSFVGTGPSSVFGAGILLVKMDSVGRVVASKSLSVSLANFSVTDMKNTADNGFVLTGYVYNHSFVIKYNADLSIAWEKQILANQANDNLTVSSICPTADGGYVLSGYSSIFSTSTNSALLIKLNAGGDITLTKTFATRDLYSENFDPLQGYNGIAVTQTSEGNYAMLMRRTNYFSGMPDSTLLCKVQTDGKLLWTKNILASAFGTSGTCMMSTPDKGLVIGGSAQIPSLSGINLTQMIMAKFSEDGTQQWLKTMSDSTINSSNASFVTIDTKGNYMFGGPSYDNGLTTLSPAAYNYFVSLKADGSLNWTRKTNITPFSLSNFNVFSFYAQQLTPTTDGGYIVGGGEFLDPQSPVSVAAFYKYDGRLQSCTGEKLDSVGSAIDIGTSASIQTNSDTASFTSTVFSHTEADFGTFLYPCSSLLPVTLLSFTANLSGSLVNVNWSTANELNADSYTVERSSDGRAFSYVQKVSAKGSSTGTFLYSTVDANPLPGTSYYRLKQTDKDGHATYSSIVKVVRSGNGSAAIYPNPVGNIIHLLLQSTTAGKMMLQVTDMTGKTVITQSGSVTVGTNTIDVPAAGLGRGMYLVRIVQDNNVQTIRVVKQ